MICMFWAPCAGLGVFLDYSLYNNALDVFFQIEDEF